MVDPGLNEANSEMGEESTSFQACCKHNITMKSACILALCMAAVQGVKIRSMVDPGLNEANSEMNDSFGKSKLEPPCSKIECGEYECPIPFELKTDNTCCGYCYAPDHVVPADRHIATKLNSTGYVVDYCDGAPKTCSSPGANAVRCFKPACREGDKPNCAPGACCAECAAR